MIRNYVLLWFLGLMGAMSLVASQVSKANFAVPPGQALQDADFVETRTVLAVASREDRLGSTVQLVAREAEAQSWHVDGIIANRIEFLGSGSEGGSLRFLLAGRDRVDGGEYHFRVIEVSEKEQPRPIFDSRQVGVSGTYDFQVDSGTWVLTKFSHQRTRVFYGSLESSHPVTECDVAVDSVVESMENWFGTAMSDAVVIVGIGRHGGPDLLLHWGGRLAYVDSGCGVRALQPGNPPEEPSVVAYQERTGMVWLDYGSKGILGFSLEGALAGRDEELVRIDNATLAPVTGKEVMQSVEFADDGTIYVSAAVIGSGVTSLYRVEVLDDAFAVTRLGQLDVEDWLQAGVGLARPQTSKAARDQPAQVEMSWTDYRSIAGTPVMIPRTRE